MKNAWFDVRLCRWGKKIKKDSIFYFKISKMRLFRNIDKNKQLILINKNSIGKLNQSETSGQFLCIFMQFSGRHHILNIYFGYIYIYMECIMVGRNKECKRVHSEVEGIANNFVHYFTEVIKYFTINPALSCFRACFTWS